MFIQTTSVLLSIVNEAAPHFLAKHSTLDVTIEQCVDRRDVYLWQNLHHLCLEHIIRLFLFCL